MQQAASLHGWGLAQTVFKRLQGSLSSLQDSCEFFHALVRFSGLLVGRACRAKGAIRSFHVQSTSHIL